MPSVAMLIMSLISLMTVLLVLRSGVLVVPMLMRRARVMGTMLWLMNVTVVTLVMMPIILPVVVLLVVLVPLNVLVERRREPELETRMPFSAGGDTHQAKGDHDRRGADEERVAHGFLHRWRSIPRHLFQEATTPSFTPG
jgi:hypothetical protein